MKRILLVDDDSSVLQLLAASLSDYDLSFARNGAEAWLAAGRGGKPDLLITDYLMPSLFGDELIARFRGPWPDLKALVLTGHSGILEQESPAWWRSEAHLAKPFSVSDLRHRVALLLMEPPLLRARVSREGSQPGLAALSGQLPRRGPV